jgi:hypothetical protein
MAASVFMVSIITTATIASRPISNFVGSMVSCRVADISKFVWGVQPVHSILMAAIVLIVSLVSIEPILPRPISFLFGSMVSCCVVNISKYA